MNPSPLNTEGEGMDEGWLWRAASPQTPLSA